MLEVVTNEITISEVHQLHFVLKNIFWQSRCLPMAAQNFMLLPTIESIITSAYKNITKSRLLLIKLVNSLAWQQRQMVGPLLSATSQTIFACPLLQSQVSKSSAKSCCNKN